MSVDISSLTVEEHGDFLRARLFAAWDAWLAAGVTAGSRDSQYIEAKRRYDLAWDAYREWERRGTNGNSTR